MVWSNFDGKPYTRKQWLAHVNALDTRRCDWVDFLCLHNTSSPTIAQWQSYPEQKRIFNLESYYENSMGWHAGPHGFIPPDESEHDENGTCIFGFTDLYHSGVHASCFNHNSLGFEMVGEFNVSPFDTPPGSYVRDNAVFVVASLCNKLDLEPDPYVYGTKGLHYHIECRRDNHDCPGIHARNKPDMIARVRAMMAHLKGLPAPPVTPPSPPPAPGVYPHGSPSWVQQTLNKLSYGPLTVDGDLGPASKAAIRKFQHDKGLDVDGLVGPITLAVLDAALSGPVPVPPPVPVPVIPGNQLHIKMTEFAGPNDQIGDRIDGYTGKIIDYRQALVALPWHFTDWQEVIIEVTNPANGKSVQCRLGDIGPWTSVVGLDQYWVKGTRPRAESNKRTNGAGIDATPGVFDALGIAGPTGDRGAVINWRRVK